MLSAVLLASMVVINVFADSQGDSLGDSQEDGYGRCYCSTRYTSNVCAGTTGSTRQGCPNTNSFIQCTNAACAISQCPIGQVWNAALNTCAACPAGQVLSFNRMKCICSQGTKYNPLTLACGPCPTGSVINGERCVCPRGLLLDKTQNACSPCPTSAPYKREEKCQCSDITLFWSQKTFSCEKCPGLLQQIPNGRRAPKNVCTCNGPNQIFDDDNVQCFTCPVGSTAFRGDCLCSIPLQRFNEVTKVCECRLGMRLNAAQTACEVIPAVNFP